VRLLALTVLLAACRYEGTFVCKTSEQCGATGVCQTSGYCSFPDTSCMSGQKYDDTAGPNAGACVGEEPGIDASVFDPATCPSTYSITISSSTSRYAIRTSLSSFWMHHTACKADLAGATHLLVPSSAQELLEVMGATETMAAGEDEFFVGVAQDISVASATDVGWTNLDGSATNPALWLSPLPFDSDGNEADHDANVAVVSRMYAKLGDASGAAAASPALCECDGKPVPALVESILAGDPNHD
jgi:hypothetical protein